MSDRVVAELDPDRKEFPHLKYPPFVANIRSAFSGAWGDLRMDGYIAGKKVISKTLSGKGANQQFHLEADARELIGDGIDATRVVMRVTDEYGGARNPCSALHTSVDLSHGFGVRRAGASPSS